jgi:hypothetical protein
VSGWFRSSASIHIDTEENRYRQAIQAALLKACCPAGDPHGRGYEMAAASHMQFGIEWHPALAPQWVRLGNSGIWDFPRQHGGHGRGKVGGGRGAEKLHASHRRCIDD